MIDAPEIYIALAQASCARFSAGDSFDQIATDPLSQLADAGSTDDNERLVGALAGGDPHAQPGARRQAQLEAAGA